LIDVKSQNKLIFKSNGTFFGTEEVTFLIFLKADKLGCRSFITPKDVTEGIYKLNLAFVANLFNNHPSLDATNIDLEDYANVEESREERSKCINLVIRGRP
jgi:hypothetical protein